MQETDLFIKLIMSVVFGAILGLETDTREIENKGEEKADKDEVQRLGGFRTYTLISLFGGIAGMFHILGAEIIAYLLFATIVAFLLSAYYLNVKLKKAFGLTTEIAIVITFALGFLTTSGLVRFEILMGILVLMAFFLSQKRGIGKFIKKIQHKELIDIIKFGLVSLLLLPILPNHSFILNDISNLLGRGDLSNESLGNFYLINPFEIWLIVVIISGISLLAYYFSRVLGTKRGILVTSILGGFFSSTSTLISFANKSKTSANQALSKRYAGGAVLSNGISYILAGILFAIMNFNLFKNVLSILFLMLITGVFYGFRFINVRNNDTKKDIDHEVIYEPFSLLPALKFVTLIVCITLLIQFMQLLKINESLIILFTAISGITGIDAPIIAISNLNNSANITLQVALITFILTNTINLVAKSIYSKFLGDKTFFIYTSIGLALTAIISLAGFIFFL